MKHSKYKQVPTFSQRHGLKEMPTPPRLEEISRQARISLSAALRKQLDSAASSPTYFDLHIYIRGPWQKVFEQVHRVWAQKPIQSFTGRLSHCDQLTSKVIFQGSYDEVFDFLELIIRSPDCPRDFTEEIAEIFQYQLAYRIDTSAIPTIVCAATKEEGDCILGAMRDLQRAGLGGAAEHLRQASEKCRTQDWAGSVRESISAVESVARQVASGNARSLGDALKSLGRQHSLHPALKEGFLKLYGYTSDEPGIRHALSDSESKVGQDEALYMIGACAAFSSYLWRKFGVQEAVSH